MTETIQEISVAPAVDSNAVGFQKLNLSPEIAISFIAIISRYRNAKLIITIYRITIFSGV